MDKNCVSQWSEFEHFLKWCIYIKIPVFIPFVMPLMWLLPTSCARSSQFTAESLWSKQFMSQTLSKYSHPLRTCNIRDVHFGEGAISYFYRVFFFFFFDTTLFEPFISRLMGLEGSLTKWVSGWRIFNDTCRKLDGFVTVLAPTSTKHLRMNLWLKHAQVLSCNVLGWATMLIYVCSHCWFHK